MIYTVEFQDLGRNKASFKVSTNEFPDGDFLYKHAKQHLLSSGMDFLVDKNFELLEKQESGISNGVVYAGFRAVGKFTVRKEKPPTNER